MATDRSPYAEKTLPVRALSARTETPFLHLPDAEEIAALMLEFDLKALRKVRLEGRLLPEGRNDWRLVARLGATAVQSCVVTLAPVTTRIDHEVERLYLADPPPAPAGETEMPEDDTVEALPDVFDFSAVLAETLSIALPDYPRAEGAELGQQSYTEPGKAPLKDDDIRPFAALKSLRINRDGPDEDR